MSDKFSVMDMIDDYAAENDINPADVFKKELKEEKPVEEVKVKKEKKEWKPDVSDMPEFKSTGAVYDKKDVKLNEDTTLRNIADDVALEESRASMDDLERKNANLEEAKARFGIRKLQIPEGKEQLNFLIAAGEPSRKKAQAELDVLFRELINIHPEFILEWDEGRGPEEYAPKPTVQSQIEAPTTIPAEEYIKEEDQKTYDPNEKIDQNTILIESGGEAPTTKIIIDKRNASDFVWTAEEAEKIRKSRTVELNIVEGKDIEFGSVSNISGNAVDNLLSKYQRKSNDAVAALPASKYRATFTGLTYPEVIDLSTSNEMNTIDAERKKWSICFSHIRNQSIGPWEEYQEYIDPKTNNIVRTTIGTEVPKDVSQDDVHIVSKFEDFLRKTSFMDLEFMLWKILCATTMDKEVVSVDCKSLYNGQPCGNTYDWIYSPSELLVTDSMNEGVLEDMKKTGEVSSTEDIMNNFASSPVNCKDYVKLSTSGFIVIYGHVSAYTYLTDLYSKIQDLNEETNDPSTVSKALAYATLSVVKEILIPNDDDTYSRITGIDNLMKVLDILDEIDWQTINELTRLMIDPYQFKFSMRNIVCPKCKNRSAIAIDSMTRLLFIVARSLSSVQVTLKKA